MKRGGAISTVLLSATLVAAACSSNSASPQTGNSGGNAQSPSGAGNRGSAGVSTGGRNGKTTPRLGWNHRLRGGVTLAAKTFLPQVTTLPAARVPTGSDAGGAVAGGQTGSDPQCRWRSDGPATPRGEHLSCRRSRLQHGSRLAVH